MNFGPGGVQALASGTMRSMTRLLLIAMLLAVCASNAKAQEPIDISMVRLLAEPKAYHGKLIRVSGFLHVGFEDNGLYLHKEDFDQALFANGIWVALSGKAESEAVKFNNTYVLMVGRFDARNTGHMGMWSGSLTDIQRMVPLKSWREMP